MPLYDYRCADCDRSFERRHGWNESPGECPSCGGTRLAKLLPTVAVQVKGGTRGAAAYAGDVACAPEGCARPGCPTGPSARLN